MPPRKSRVWLRALAGLVALALVGGGIGVLVYAHTYQPLATGSGPFGSITPNTLKTLGDGLEDTNSIIVGPAGTKGTADITVMNNGSHAVRLLGLDQSQAVLGESLSWASASDDSQQAIALLSDARQFPVTVPPHGEVVLQDTVTQPRCPSANGTQSIISIPVRWSALGVHHVWDLWLQGGSATVPITVCAPPSALAHVSND
jgi:hypothetical protein